MNVCEQPILMLFCEIKCIANCICQAKLGIGLTALLYTMFFMLTQGG